MSKLAVIPESGELEEEDIHPNRSVVSSAPPTLDPIRPLYSLTADAAVANFLTHDDGSVIFDDDYDEASAVPSEPSSDSPSHSPLVRTSGSITNQSSTSLASFKARVMRGPSRFLRGSSTSLDSVAGFFTPEPGQKTLKLSEFCNLIAKCASLERAKIISVECYREWTLYGIMHRTLIFHLERKGRSDVWLRVDRRRSHEVSGIKFMRQGGKTEANDVAHLAGTKEYLLRSPRAKPENRIEFGAPPNLGTFRFCLQIICEELLEYHIWPSNCWFMCSLLQEHLFETGQGTFKLGDHIRLDLAPDVRTQVRNRVWHVVKPSSLTDESRTEEDMSTPLPTVTPRWKTLDGRFDTRDFDFPLLATVVDGLLHTMEEHHGVIADNQSRDDLHMSIIELAGRAIGLEFILRQQTAVPSSSRALNFLSTHLRYLSRHASAPLHLPFLEYLRHVYRIAPETAWHDTASRLVHTARIISTVNPAASRTYAQEARSIITAHSEGERHWTSGQMLDGHTRDVNCLAFSPDGKQIASASDDVTIRRWDALTGESIGEPMRGHTGQVIAVAFSPDGTQIVSGSNDDSLRRWDVSSGEPIGASMRGHTESVLSVAYSPDGKVIVSGSFDRTVRRWNASSGEAVGKPLKGHTHSVHSVAFSPDGRRIVSGSDDKTIRLWDAVTGEAVDEAWKGHTSWIFSVAFSPDGRFVVSGSHDDTVRRWNALTGENIGDPMTGHTESVSCVAVSPDGKQIASGSSDCSIRLWNAFTGELIGEPLEGHTELVWSVAFSPDGRQIVSGSRDGTVRIWDSLIDLDRWAQSE